MPDYVKFPLVMLIVTLISASALAYIFQVAEPRIEAQRRRKEQAAEKIVFARGEAGGEKTTSTVRYKEVMEDGQLAGYLVKGQAAGYSSTIEVLVGVRTDLTVNGVTILEQKETPGLGTRVEEVASDVTWILILTGEKTLGHAPGEEAPRPWFTEKYRGLAADAISLTADGGAIDAITGATVSSRAVTDAVRTAVEGLAETLSGAK